MNEVTSMAQAGDTTVACGWRYAQPGSDDKVSVILFVSESSSKEVIFRPFTGSTSVCKGVTWEESEKRVSVILQEENDYLHVLRFKKNSRLYGAYGFRFQ